MVSSINEMINIVNELEVLNREELQIHSMEQILKGRTEDDLATSEVLSISKNNINAKQHCLLNSLRTYVNMDIMDVIENLNT